MVKKKRNSFILNFKFIERNREIFAFSFSNAKICRGSFHEFSWEEGRGMKRDIERTKLFSRKGWLVRAAKGQERWKVAERFERRAQGGLVENGRWLSKGENCQEPEAGRLSHIPEAVSSVKVRFSKKKKAKWRKKKKKDTRKQGLEGRII